MIYNTTSTRNGPGVAMPSAKRSLNASIVVTLAPGHTHRARQPHPVEIGVAEVEHVECFAAGIAGADIG